MGCKGSRVRIPPPRPTTNMRVIGLALANRIAFLSMVALPGENCGAQLGEIRHMAFADDSGALGHSKFRSRCRVRQRKVAGRGQIAARGLMLSLAAAFGRIAFSVHLCPSGGPGADGSEPTAGPSSSVPGRQLESVDLAGQPDGLILQCGCGCGRLFHQCRVLLRHAVELVHGRAHLRYTIALLRGGR